MPNPARPDSRSLRLPARALAILILGLFGAGGAVGADGARATDRAAPEGSSFGPGTLIVPMDLGPGGADSGQNNAMLRAYGLVYSLLRAGVPVHWAIDPDKVPNGVDFPIVASGNSVRQVRTLAAVTLPRDYRGGPFLIAPEDAAAALPIVQAWQATPGDATVVHEVVTGTVPAEIARTLGAAPRVAVLQDGNEGIAFNNLNAAGIPDGVGGSWSNSSPELLTEAQVRGASDLDDDDGALHDLASGLDRICHLSSMHYNSTSATPEVVQETRAWLGKGPRVALWAQCDSVNVFENAVAGKFLTTGGLVDDGSAPSAPTNRVPADPHAQIDGAFTADSGTVDSIGLMVSSAFVTGATTLINDNAAGLTTRINLVTGRMDGSVPPDRGRVTYLGGHDYSLLLPISSNPQTNGVRLYLDSIFAADCALEPAQADVALTVESPAGVSGTEIVFTIELENPGPRAAENLRLSAPVPPGATFVSATDGGVHSSGTVSWTLPTLASGATDSVSFTVGVVADGPYATQATLRFAHLALRTVRSAIATTLRDTVAPTVEITGGPSGTTSDTTPTFSFTADEPVDFDCRIDGGEFFACGPEEWTADPLTNGAHAFEVRGTDVAGFDDTAFRAFVIDGPVPQVESIATVAATGLAPGAPAPAHAAAFAVRAPLTRVLVEFGVAMSQAGGGSVTSTANWKAIDAGPNQQLETSVCTPLAGDDFALSIDALGWDEGASTAVVELGGATGLGAGGVRLLACPTITDEIGNPLDGAGDEGAAEAFVFDLEQLAAPAVENPNFDESLAGWTPLGPAPGDWTAAGTDGDGSPFSGAARLDTANGAAESWELRQCVELVPGEAFVDRGLTARVRVVSAGGTDPTVGAALVFFDGAGCTGGSLGTAASPLVEGGTGGAWRWLVLNRVTPPVGAESARLRLLVEGGATAAYEVELDRVLYPDDLVLFDDGFESGDGCRWSAQTGGAGCG